MRRRGIAKREGKSILIPFVRQFLNLSSLRARDAFGGSWGLPRSLGDVYENVALPLRPLCERYPRTASPAFSTSRFGGVASFDLVTHLPCLMIDR